MKIIRKFELNPTLLKESSKKIAQYLIMLENKDFYLILRERSSGLLRGACCHSYNRESCGMICKMLMILLS